MLPAVCTFFLSLLGGGLAACLNPGWGAVVSVSVVGAFIVYSLDKDNK